ncbi:GUN4 domain-containing protein [Leptolyngbya sp. FACHB-16]|uniref:GUN4 domain-containing protein n=1 Tax=unclassified Leptolyngbya TaxID=2650499 RepID=UPI0016874A1C|nr:GUN4 domain-containing protein [Leptolyngbya sp. FACHB-16]MBD2156300.1 GUN4 domain-containing protein [Leptolyngbya sp. FACHB-16]
MSSHESFESESSVSSDPKKRIPGWVKGLGIVAIALSLWPSLWRDVPYFLGYGKPSLDYRSLEAKLQAKDWDAADQLTTEAFLQLAEIKGSPLLSLDAAWFHRVPCADLQTMDRLWTQYSERRYGLSVQRDIFLAVQAQNPDHPANRERGLRALENMDQFTEQVGHPALNHPQNKDAPGHYPSFSILMKPSNISIISGSIPFATPEVVRRITWCRL